MMRLNNGSLTSLGSDKDLPAIPPPRPKSKPASLNLASNYSRSASLSRPASQHEPVSASLSRPSSVYNGVMLLTNTPKPSSPLVTSHPASSALSSPPGKADLDAGILQTKTLRRKNFKKLSLEANNDVVAKPDSFAVPSLMTRPKVRPAPLLDVNKSNRNVDPDSQTSKNIIIDQFSSLDINAAPAPQLVTRKRQTVISSISPTKSLAPSPLDNHYDLLNLNQGSPISTTSAFKFNNDDIVTLKNLGSGNSGTVSKILHVPTQKTMAKKTIQIDLKTVVQTQIIRELRILHECQSPYIVDFFGAFVNNNNTIVICMEYCNCGSLDKILQLCLPKQFPLAVLKKLAFAMLSGLSYLYTHHKIIHRDIKPSNVVMTHKGEFKLCDFGVSRHLTNSLAMADTFVGTSTYMSPERIQGHTYGVKSDVWSMGLVLYEMASGKQVWCDDDDEVPSGPEGILDLLQRIVNEKPPSLTKRTNPLTGAYYDDKLCEFIDSCLVQNDSKRKSPEDLLRDKCGFFEGVADGVFDKEVKSWAKKIRKLHKEKYETLTPK